VSTLLLETHGLSKHFGGVAAVDRVDFKIEAGELRCLIGPNGAGKSTFFKLLTGQLQPTSGTILFNGSDITGQPTSKIARHGIGMKMQSPMLFDGLPVLENLWLAARRRFSDAEAVRTAERTLDLVGLSAVARSAVGFLSHGQRALVELAIVLASDPELLLLDEPTAGMTADETVRTADIIRTISRRHTMVIVEHDMNFIRMIASKVTVFHRGSILIEDTMGNIFINQTVRDIYLGHRTHAENA
jgi:branched-chain amino acid transport system ATP-binding protein